MEVTFLWRSVIQVWLRDCQTCQFSSQPSGYPWPTRQQGKSPNTNWTNFSDRWFQKAIKVLGRDKSSMSSMTVAILPSTTKRGQMRAVTVRKTTSAAGPQKVQIANLSIMMWLTQVWRREQRCLTGGCLTKSRRPRRNLNGNWQKLKRRPNPRTKQIRWINLWGLWNNPI